MGSIYDTPPRRYSLTIFWIKNLQLILRLTAKCVLCIWNHTSVKDFVMAHTISAVYLHVIFSCKDHRPFIQPDWKDELYHYMGGILKNIGVQPIRIGGSTDHVHTLCSVGTESAISSIVRTLKAGSSTWVKSWFNNDFSWQIGYGVFSVGQSQLPQVKSYIENQEKHHLMKSFAEELNEIMTSLGVNSNQRVWSFNLWYYRDSSRIREFQKILLHTRILALKKGFLVDYSRSSV